MNCMLFIQQGCVSVTNDKHVVDLSLHVLKEYQNLFHLFVSIKVFILQNLFDGHKDILTNFTHYITHFMSVFFSPFDQFYVCMILLLFGLFSIVWHIEYVCWL